MPLIVALGRHRLPGLYSEYQDSQDYIETLSQERRGGAEGGKERERGKGKSEGKKRPGNFPLHRSMLFSLLCDPLHYRVRMAEARCEIRDPSRTGSG